MIAVFSQCCDPVIEQALCPRVSAERSTVVPAEPAAPGAYPDVAGMILKDRVHVIHNQTILFGVAGDGLFGDSTKSCTPGSHPQSAFAILEYGVDVVRGEALPSRIGCAPSAFEPDKARSRRADPQITLAILTHWPKRAVQPISFVVDGEGSVFQAV